MHVIILAAGQSKRFKDAGYEIPKPFLFIHWRGRTMTMLDHVLQSIPRQIHKISIVVQQDHLDIASDSMSTHSIYFTFETTKPTKGPADSAWAAMTNTPFIQSTLILDSDIINHTNDLMELAEEKYPSVLAHKSDNPGYSYVNSTGIFGRIKEKECISPYAVCGAYFIPKPYMEEFMAAQRTVIDELPEPFLSHVFDRLPGIKTAKETTYDPVDWGTPEAVKASGATICT